MSPALVRGTDQHHHLACTWWASFSSFPDYSGLLPFYLWQTIIVVPLDGWWQLIWALPDFIRRDVTIWAFPGGMHSNSNQQGGILSSRQLSWNHLFAVGASRLVAWQHGTEQGVLKVSGGLAGRNAMGFSALWSPHFTRQTKPMLSPAGPKYPFLATCRWSIPACSNVQ